VSIEKRATGRELQEESYSERATASELQQERRTEWISEPISL
jgi:hypothetical protein